MDELTRARINSLPNEQWVSVLERLPEKEAGKVVVATVDKDVEIVSARYLRGMVAAAERDGDSGFYTHWQMPPVAP